MMVTDEEGASEWPSLAVEVFSLDYWDRHNIQGYGLVSLPQQQGIYFPGF